MKLAVLFWLSIIFSCSSPSRISEETQVRFDWEKIKSNLRARIQKIKSQNQIPLIDVESSFGEVPFYVTDKTDWFTKLELMNAHMDSLHIAFIALSPEKRSLKIKDENGKANFDFGLSWGKLNHKIYDLGYSWIMPNGIGSQPEPKFNAQEYRSHMFDEILRDHYPMMGEFFFRHYPSQDQIQVNNIKDKSDYNTPIDGPIGEEFFAFSAAHDIPLQIHYEIEDKLLPALENILGRYPKAKIIWAHLARVRKPQLSTIYGANWIESMILKYPNLYFDLSASAIDNVYPPGSDTYISTFWNRQTRHLQEDWKKVIAKYPWRFMVAFDLGSDRFGVSKLVGQVNNSRKILQEFPPEIAEILAYKAAWKLIFKEELTF